MDKDFGENEICMLQNADIALIQYIKNDRPYINHERIRGILKNDCKVILLPHYVFDGYFVKIKLPEEFTIEKSQQELMSIFNNIEVDAAKVITNYENALVEFKSVAATGSIDVSDIMLNHFKNVRLFNGRGYPTSIFFRCTAIEIIKFLGYGDDIDTVNIDCVDTGFAHNIKYPILPKVKEILDLKFDWDNITNAGEQYSLLEYLFAYKENNNDYINLHAYPAHLESIKKYKRLLKDKI